MRRAFFTLGVSATLLSSSLSPTLGVEPSVSELEQRHGGRLGVYAMDLGTGRIIANRANERFPMCSTFKMLAAGAVLAQVDRGKLHLSRSIAYSTKDLQPYSPVTRSHITPNGVGAMTIEQLCSAAVSWSDNTAGNLLLGLLGGPCSITAFARSIGDQSTRLDRFEPQLNEAIPGDPRDTTTPFCMVSNIHKLIFGETLGSHAGYLRAWMLQCHTSDSRIPAGLPKTWRSGNKTGTGDYATANDVAFLLPPRTVPKIVAVYFTASRASRIEQDSTLAEVGRIVSTQFDER